MTTFETYVITGANRGIGLELTRQALALGHKVIAGVRLKNLSRELGELASENPELLNVMNVDVKKDEAVANFADDLRIDHIDVLINNAGIYLDEDGPATIVPTTDLLDTLNTNAVGPVRVTQALFPYLKRAPKPRVANISSLMGSISDNSSGGSLAYRMSKAALNMFTKTLALDDKEIIALSLHPGWVKTSMGGPQAPLAPSDSASGLLKFIDAATIHHSGRFFNYAGQELPW